MNLLRQLVPFGTVVVLAVSGCGGSESGSTATPRLADASSSATPPVDEAAAVTLTFQNYKDAALAKDGTAAADLLADTTHAFYDESRTAALTATEQELAALGPVERLTVLVMRGSLAADVLRSASPKKLLVAAVEAGLIGEAGTSNVDIGEVTVSGQTASAAAIVRGEVAPFDLAFVRQDGQWKFDLLPLLDLGRAGLEEAAKQQGMTVDQLIESTLTQKYGPEKFDQLVSQPIGR